MMERKTCALCALDIEEQNEPAILFVGKYGRRYEICTDCEHLMDTFVSSEDEGKRNEAAKTVYNHLFSEGVPKSMELLEFYKNLFDEGEGLAEAQKLLREYEEEERASCEEEALTEEEPTANEISEAEFLADREKPLGISVKIFYLFLFLLLGGAAVGYGILQSIVSLIVAGALVALLGIGMLFSK